MRIVWYCIAYIHISYIYMYILYSEKYSNCANGKPDTCSAPKDATKANLAAAPWPHAAYLAAGLQWWQSQAMPMLEPRLMVEILHDLI